MAETAEKLLEEFNEYTWDTINYDVEERHARLSAIISKLSNEFGGEFDDIRAEFNYEWKDNADRHVGYRFEEEDGTVWVSF